MSPFNHQQKCLINGICGIFDMKSNHEVIPPNLGAEVSLKSEADALSR